MFIGVDGFQSEADKSLWYLAWPAIFNVGWAAVQIAHMAIINSLSFSQRMRDKMVVYRNGFTYTANIIVLGLALLLFSSVCSHTIQFRILSVSCVALGLPASIFYLITVREQSLSQVALEREASFKQQNQNTEGIVE